MKEGVEAAKALWVGGVRPLLAGKIKVGTSLFQVCCLSEILIFPERASSAEGPDPCELAQNPRYRKGPDVCFDNNENVRHKHGCRDGIKRNKKAENLFISEPRQLNAVRFCLVLISSVDCLASLFVLVIDLLSSLFIHLSLFCMHVLSFSFFSFMWSLHSSPVLAAAAAAFVW